MKRLAALLASLALVAGCADTAQNADTAMVVPDEAVLTTGKYGTYGTAPAFGAFGAGTTPVGVAVVACPPHAPALYRGTLYCLKH